MTHELTGQNPVIRQRWSAEYEFVDVLQIGDLIEIVCTLHSMQASHLLASPACAAKQVSVSERISFAVFLCRFRSRFLSPLIDQDISPSAYRAALCPDVDHCVGLL